MNHKLIVGALLALAACSQGEKKEDPTAPEPPAIHVETVAVANAPMPHELPLTGQLVANQQSEVAANGAGRVVKTLVERGTYVKEGTTLLQLDTKSAQLSEAEAKANLSTAMAAQELADTLCKRNQELFDKGAISKEEWERTGNQCKTSAATVEAAHARADMAAKTLSDATVRAPFSGMIGERYVSVGEYVQPATRVVSLVELDPLRLQLTVPEADIGQVQEGREVSFKVDAFADRKFTGTVKFVDPTVRSNTRDLIVEAVVENPDHVLKPGMFATAHLQLPDEPLPVVPKTAIFSEGSTAHLFAVVDKHVEERIVQLGPERDGKVAVLDGLKAGDTVVAQLSDAVKDGVPVK
ncbi:MAG: efflux RND transporter periplasmic adaptor subunit [Deltaproteobacteria bacterium]|nr:efflux RND transporter periplasmic adaptor subunit [Deltaproteobacteria bacterium]